MAHYVKEFVSRVSEDSIPYLVKERTVRTEEVYIRSYDDVVNLVNSKPYELNMLDHEETLEIVMNNKGRVIGISKVAIGCEDSALISIRMVVRNCLLMGGAGIILSHNHPSGITEPSTDDIQLTNKLKEAAELMNMRLLDHIIVGDSNSTSLAEKGII